MTDIQTCPRRMTEPGPWEQREGMDEWLERPHNASGVAPVCSFCGSLHPGKFLELAARGWMVEPTDKRYKAYLHQVLQGPERTSASGEPLPPLLTKSAKFYYQHLTVEQQQHFIDLYNAGTMHLTSPGDFYVPPFFMVFDQ